MLARKHRYTIFIGYGEEAGGILKHYEQLKHRLGIGTNTMFIRFLLDFYEKHKPDSNLVKETHIEHSINDENTKKSSKQNENPEDTVRSSCMLNNENVLTIGNANFLNANDVDIAVTALSNVGDDSTEVQCELRQRTTTDIGIGEITEVALEHQECESRLNITTQDTIFENSNDRVPLHNKTSSSNNIIQSLVVNDRENNKILPVDESIKQLDETDSKQEVVDNNDDDVKQILKDGDVGPSSSKCSKLESTLIDDDDDESIAQLVIVYNLR